MTRISFYFNAPDKFQVAARLSQKAVDAKNRVLIFAPDTAKAHHMDQLLWTYSSISFMPHCMAEDVLAAETPVLIASDPETLPHDEVLLNLGDDWPPAFSRFNRLLEIVGQDDADRSHARARFKFYKDRGYEIESVDLAKVGEK